MALTFKDLANEVLSQSTTPLSITDIWHRAVESNLDKKLSRYGKTPIKTLNAQIYVDIRDNGEDSRFIQVSKRPALFWLKNKDISNSQLSNTEPKQTKNKSAFKERDLHIILSSFVYADPNFHCLTKTIMHEKSSKKNKGVDEWIHPDIVGVRLPFDAYGDSTRDLMRSMSINICKLFSFEVKIELSSSNLRKNFFQAVSNSSWANEGYLVALKYEEDSDFEDEMRKLNTAFGIGFIQLDVEDYSQSLIRLSAKANDDLDWNMINRLCEDNVDFKVFADVVESNLSLNKKGAVSDDKFDAFYNSIENYRDYIEKKGICV
jgi:hypothetical protein